MRGRERYNSFSATPTEEYKNNANTHRANRRGTHSRYLSITIHKRPRFRAGLRGADCRVLIGEAHLAMVNIVTVPLINPSTHVAVLIFTSKPEFFHPLRARHSSHVLQVRGWEVIYRAMRQAHHSTSETGHQVWKAD